MLKEQGCFVINTHTFLEHDCTHAGSESGTSWTLAALLYSMSCTNKSCVHVYVTYAHHVELAYEIISILENDTTRFTSFSVHFLVYDLIDFQRNLYGGRKMECYLMQGSEM